MRRSSISLFLALCCVVLIGCSTSPADTSGQPSAQNGENGGGQGENVTVPTEDLLSMQDKLSEIVKSGDVTRCAELTMEQYLTSCEVTLLSAQAKDAADTVVCDAATNEKIKARCVAAVEAIE